MISKRISLLDTLYSLLLKLFSYVAIKKIPLCPLCPSNYEGTHDSNYMDDLERILSSILMRFDA